MNFRMKFHLVNKLDMKKIITIIVALVGFTFVLMAEIPDRPQPQRLVNDFANVLDNGEVSQMENALEQFAKQTSTQLVVVTVPDLEGFDKADYAFQLGEKWGIGQKGKDNGLVVLVKPKTRDSRGEVFIATEKGVMSFRETATASSDFSSMYAFPNPVSPNYDGIIAISGVADQATILITDISGNKVFETNDKTQGWDGTFKGEAMTPNVYGWYCEGVCPNGEDYFLKGNVTLLK